MPLFAPTADELLQNPAVQKALSDAWNDSQPADANRRHEEGGWIYMDVSNGKITIERAIRGSHHRIDLTQPISIVMSHVVGKFHTHPNPSSERWDPRPSQKDAQLDWKDGVPDLIVSDQGVFTSGPSSRRGGLAGPAGYPL